MEAHLITADPGAAQRQGGAGPATAPVDHDGVVVHAISRRSTTRLVRMVFLAPKAILKARELRAELIHIHDPELLPWARLLWPRSAQVVYDIHEDYTVALAHRHYLPRLIRRLGARIFHLLERAWSKPFGRVIAERVYARRFADATLLPNYPRLSLASGEPSVDPESRALLYTGNVTRDRGALQLARMVRELPEVHLTLAGKCAAELAAEIRAVVGSERIEIIGEGRHVPFEEIVALYRERRWLAGVVLMPESPHYREKELTKFFEYMAAGLPIIASDFPVWRKLIVEQDLGLCVDPGDVRMVRQAIAYLGSAPDHTRAMGARGQELVRREYAWEHLAPKLITLYRNLMATRTHRETTPRTDEAAS